MSPSPTTDKHQDYTAFYLKYNTRLIHFINNRAYSFYSDVDDMAADTWLKVWVAWDTFRGDRNSSRFTWVCRIALNVILTKGRTTHYRVRTSLVVDLNDHEKNESLRALTGQTVNSVEAPVHIRELMECLSTTQTALKSAVQNVISGTYDGSNPAQKIGLFRARKEFAEVDRVFKQKCNVRKLARSVGVCS